MEGDDHPEWKRPNGRPPGHAFGASLVLCFVLSLPFWIALGLAWWNE